MERTSANERDGCCFACAVTLLPFRTTDRSPSTDTERCVTVVFVSVFVWTTTAHVHAHARTHARRPMQFAVESTRDNAFVSNLAVLLERLSASFVERHGTALDTIVSAKVIELFVRVVLSSSPLRNANASRAALDVGRGDSLTTRATSVAVGGGGGGGRHATSSPTSRQHQRSARRRLPTKTLACVLHALSGFGRDYVRVIPRIIDAGGLLSQTVGGVWVVWLRRLGWRGGVVACGLTAWWTKRCHLQPPTPSHRACA